MVGIPPLLELSTIRLAGIRTISGFGLKGADNLTACERERLTVLAVELLLFRIRSWYGIVLPEIVSCVMLVETRTLATPTRVVVLMG
jgi:hypothetical protein